MPINISNAFSNFISQKSYHVQNPNYITGTLIEEIPADAGKSYQGYKRGGILEGLEKMRRELMSAAVWICGIPLIDKAGTFVCEKFLKLPMDMDYSNETIDNVVQYLKNGENPNKLDTSDLAKYSKMSLERSSEDLIKKIKIAKNISSIGALILNCMLMGFVIPKVNQVITRNKMKKMSKKQDTFKTDSFESFKEKTNKNNKQISFGATPLEAAGKVTYLVQNDNRFRLLITDIPMIIGRVITSRNKYEALEIFVVDSGGTIFYNFVAYWVLMALRKLTKTPALNPMVAKTFIEANEATIKSAMDKISSEPLKVSELFEDKEFSDKIYKQSTFGKYGKLNRYVPQKDMDKIDNEVFKYMKTLRSKIGYDKNAQFNMNEFKKYTKLYNVKSAGFLALGFASAIAGLAYILPKLSYKITEKLTGKNQFTGIANYDNDKKDNVTKS